MAWSVFQSGFIQFVGNRLLRDIMDVCVYELHRPRVFEVKV